jgi:hypothetical protein
MRGKFVEFKGHIDPVIREVLDESKQSENKMLLMLWYRWESILVPKEINIRSEISLKKKKRK